MGCLHDLSAVRSRIAAMEAMLIPWVIDPEMFAKAMF